ncbi:MAG: isoprenylcysteine carboxylmethyltransferase family protein [Alphaproteobacteria bacterium]|nr:isoprenylcysteine carboxylmethyltransferase family protein [Alphaproteobacteria bacterium]
MKQSRVESFVLPSPHTAPLGWMPPRTAWALLLLGALLHLLPGMPVLLRLPVAAALSVGLGLAMAVGSKRRFQRIGLPLPPTGTGDRLLIDGWYGWSRNPMYLGIALVLAGAGLALGSPAALLAPVVFLGIVRRWFVPFEEEQLAASFGEQWCRYAHRVPRWL